ncbi:hypothetical protein WL766_06765 [Staphylococcus pasteuri]|uniref:Mid2-like cell wall stress sensor domain protein n=1 Tax=Staphylococcus pasteuri_A TaxID=3062664 RepID=A0AAW7YSD2_9STAP|nr:MULTISPECIES: hypothetical protein [Staphylococcus]KKI56871.1 hypothetical protein UF70_0514 [Staphylococcus pasteuri]MCD9065919.1 hypothetical protein [Staphylococcus pasteuri]MCF7598637.1 hypothetical protein [Staphylococcus pasteuri]MCO5358896.1 hypothetical protein [Staphylococcus pasteuri]MCT1925348.1 hypothetical protein [Staphylococcus pasteuri]
MFSIFIYGISAILILIAIILIIRAQLSRHSKNKSTFVPSILLLIASLILLINGLMRL